MFTDKIIDKITEEVEKRVIANLENLKFNIEVTIVKDKDNEDGISHRDKTV
jgi:hypothetical protein